MKTKTKPELSKFSTSFRDWWSLPSWSSSLILEVRFCCALSVSRRMWQTNWMRKRSGPTQSRFRVLIISQHHDAMLMRWCWRNLRKTNPTRSDLFCPPWMSKYRVYIKSIYRVYIWVYMSLYEFYEFILYWDYIELYRHSLMHSYLPMISNGCSFPSL